MLSYHIVCLSYNNNKKIIKCCFHNSLKMLFLRSILCTFFCGDILKQFLSTICSCQKRANILRVLLLLSTIKSPWNNRGNPRLNFQPKQSTVCPEWINIKISREIQVCPTFELDSSLTHGQHILPTQILY